jgi:SAM-dependent methyltransferase
VPKQKTKKSDDAIGKPATERKSSLESLIKYSGDAPLLTQRFDLDLFTSLNADYRATPVVPAPRPHSHEYGTSIGAKRAAMLEKKIGIRGLRVLEIGCGAGAMSRVLAREFDCDVTGVDIGDYPEWQAPLQGDLSLQIHDITTQDNSRFGLFDRVVSFAVFEHIVHPHAAFKAIFDMLKPGGKAYIYANLYRGAKASHRYREVYFPWAHLLFEPEVWRDFYTRLQGEPLEPAWVNKLTYDQYVNYAGRIGFEVLEHFPSAPFFDEAFYQRFEQRLSAYPKFDLMHDFIHLVLQKPSVPSKIETSLSAVDEFAGLDPFGVNPARLIGHQSTLEIGHISAIRRSLAATPPRAYDRISYLSDDVFESCISSIEDGKAYEMFGQLFAKADVIGWKQSGNDRSARLFIKSWDHLEPFFLILSRRGDAPSFQTLLDCLIRWEKLTSRALEPALAKGNEHSTGESFLNYDTAVSNRFFRLAYFLQTAASRDQVSDEQFLSLLKIMLEHASILFDNTNFSRRHNHGIYQTLALMCGASRFINLDGGQEARLLALTMRRAFRQAVDRLDILLHEHFTTNGVHKEHSPMYHVSVANAVGWVANERVLEDPAIIAASKRISGAAMLMIDDEGNIANFGDTDIKFPIRYAPETDSLSACTSTLLKDAGYWLVKGRGTVGATFLAQSCAFHSRVHKHADSGTLVWRDCGLDVLIDSGRYGYLGRTTPGSPLFLDGFWYSDPKRVHVESTRAHNTVEIDQQNHRRYRQAPLGGTITGERFNNGVHASRCTIPNAARAQHQRFTLLLPNHWLLVVDTCRFPDGAHNMRQWFQLHPDWIHRAEEGNRTFLNGEQRLSITPLLANMETDGIFRGERVEPVSAVDSGYRGWWSPEAMRFEPCTSVAFRAKGDFLNMATLISFDDVDPKGVTASVNATSRSFVFRWKDAQGRNEVKLMSGGLGREEFDIAFKSAQRQNMQ